MARVPRSAAILAAFLSAGSGACDDDPAEPSDPEFPEDSPRVLEVTPTPQATQAPLLGDLVIRFDRALDPSRIGSLRVFGRWTGVVTGTSSLSADGLELRFTPTRSLSAGEWVTVTLPVGAVRSTEGVGMEPGYSWGFWTRTGVGTLVQTETRQVPVRRPGEDRIQTYGAYAGDLDGDGWSDLVLPNERSNDLRIFMNDGGDFDSFSVVPIPMGDRPSTNEGADFNNDGHIDFVVGNAAGSTATVYLGDGTGGLATRQTMDVGDDVRGICVLDFEGDGDMDIAAASFVGGVVGLYRNDGQANFSALPSLDVGIGEWSCASTDMDGDGLFDLVVGARGNPEIVVLGSRGNGTFSELYRAPAAGDPWMLAAGDLDSDGQADVVSVNADAKSLTAFVGIGDGTLSAPTPYALDGFPLALDLGDLDGDGDLDAVASDFSTASFILFENDGAGGFTRLSTELPAPMAGSCAILHDRDRDGDLDITGIDEVVDMILLFENR